MRAGAFSILSSLNPPTVLGPAVGGGMSTGASRVALSLFYTIQKAEEAQGSHKECVLEPLKSQNRTHPES